MSYFCENDLLASGYQVEYLYLSMSIYLLVQLHILTYLMSNLWVEMGSSMRKMGTYLAHSTWP